MASGMWTAAAGAAAQTQNLDLIANNLANADTPGFKKDLPTFKEYLATLERTHDKVDIPKGPIKDKDFYPLDGRDESYVVTDGTYTNFHEGHLRVTQAPLDLALDGPGFFEVNTPSGSKYTRFGGFKVSPEGRLVNSEGYPVLAQKAAGLAGDSLSSAPGATPSSENASRYIELKDRGGHFSINLQGEIYAGDELVGKLSVTEFQDQKKLRKTANQLFENKDPTNKLPAATQTVIRQGVIETSNVNPVEEMANMIKANRLFEHDLKALKTYGELLGKEANEVGKL